MKKQNLFITIAIIIIAFLFITNPGFTDIPFWPNIKVNHNEEPSSQEETTIAAHGNYLVAGYHHIIENDITLTTDIYCAVSYSHDGGETWHSDLMPLPAGYSKACDPAVAVSDDGTFYYAQLSLGSDNQVFISRSDDHGVTWTTPVEVCGGALSGHALDKEWVASQGDNVYITFTDFSAPSGTDIFFVRSTDRGASFESHIKLNDVAVAGSCNGTAIAYDGTNVYVFWKNFSNSNFYMARSIDQGATFEPDDVMVANLNALDYPGFRTTGQFPSVKVNPLNHHIYCAYMDGLGVGDPSEIYFTISSDNGSTWSTPTRVNDDAAGNGQWFPWIDIDDTGICHIVWYDERNNTGSLGDYLDLYYATYDESINTFGTNRRVTDQTFAVVTPPEPGIATF
ncbi:MAG: exo-alpha-sialidase, partial [Candidatus Aminicenantes bacterium]|nr:exo-alpha-sialidase [Candidatus Aminicenantes bacterium]